MPVFTNSTGITFPSSGNFSQTLDVTGLAGHPITDIKVILTGFTHTFSDDIDLLLVHPDGTRNLVFLSDAGGNNAASGLTLTIADSGTALLPDATAFGTGTFNPTNHLLSGADSFGAGAPTTLNSAAPTGASTFSAAFGGALPNGTWTLFGSDDIGGGTGSLGSWALDITVSNATPDATNDARTTAEDSPLTIPLSSLLTNDTDANGDPLAVTSVAAGANGAVTLSGGNVTFTPNANFNGTASFAYLVADGFGGTDVATVNVTVSEVPDPLVLIGTPDPDSLTGGPLNDFIQGRGSGDRIFGGAGIDRLFGELGNDLLDAGPGNDLLDGGRGRDVLIGDSGRDRFDFNALSDSRPGNQHDTVFFSRGQRDRIDLRDIDAERGAGGNQRFQWIGDNAFSGDAGELRFDNGLLQGDVNGDRRVDFEVLIVGALLRGDVIL